VTSVSTSWPLDPASRRTAQSSPIPAMTGDFRPPLDFLEAAIRRIAAISDFSGSGTA
jgi:hypothetical protein